MTEIRHAIGETVRLALSVVTTGTGVTGLSPVVIIRRKADGFWFNGSIASPGNPFTSSFATNAMAPLDATNLPGVYFYDFPQARDTNIISDYEVRMQSISGTAAIDDLTLRMGPLVAASIAECTIFGTLVDGAGRPLVNSLVRATVIPVAVPGAGQGVVITPPITVMTDETGFFQMSLLQGLNIRLEIQDIGYDNSVLVPSVTSTPFTMLI